MSKAIVLGGGPSLKEYKEAEHDGAFVVCVNDVYFVAKELFRKPLKIDLCICQDRYDKFLKGKPIALKTPIEVEMQFVNPSWQTFATKRGNANVVVSSPHASDINRIDDKRFPHLHGNTSVVAGLLEALKRGYNELYLYGHDCSKGHSLDNKNAKVKTLKELNFIAHVAEAKGGFLKVASTSELWQYKGDEWPELQAQKAEKPKRSRKKSPPKE